MLHTLFRGQRLSISWCAHIKESSSIRSTLLGSSLKGGEAKPGIREKLEIKPRPLKMFFRKPQHAGFMLHTLFRGQRLSISWCAHIKESSSIRSTLLGSKSNERHLEKPISYLANMFKGGRNPKGACMVVL